MNMYLHHFTKPKISEYDTLTSEEKWDVEFDRLQEESNRSVK